MSRERQLALALAFGLLSPLACRSAKPTSRESTASAVVASGAKPSKSRPSGTPLEPEPADSTVRIGPLPPGASREAREQAVISLLRGIEPAERLREIATDDGGVVDPRLRDVLAPKQTTVVESPPPRPPTGLMDPRKRPYDPGYPL